MAEKIQGLKLRVSEALQDDAYKGIARIDFEVMKELGIKRGDVISIKGGKETIAIADKSYPADVGEGIIRIDGIIRKNARTGVSENVVVQKVVVKEAKKVTVAPAQRGIMVQGDLKPGLLGRAVVKGDIVVLGGVKRRRDLMSEDMENMLGGLGDIFGDAFGGMGLGGMQQIRFMITNTSPSQPCVITENTEVTLSNKPVEESDEAVSNVTYEDIGGLTDEVKKIREMVEIPLKHPEIFEKLGVEPPKGVLLHGPPGTGKTLLAKAVANETEANFILLNGPEIMCVSGDTPIFTNPEGYVKAEEIYKKDGEIESHNSYLVKKLKNPIATYSFKEGVIEKAHITHTTKLNAESFNLKLSDGNQITVSENQPFLIYKNGKLIWEPTKNIKKGDFVARLNKINLPEESYDINLDLLKEKVPVVEENNRYAIKSINLSRSNFIKLPKKTSPELLELFGLVVSDGNISNKDDGIGFYNKDNELIERFKFLMKEVFEMDNFKEKNQGDCKGVVFYSKILVKYLEILGFTNDNKENIPAYFFKLPKSEIRAFVRGYFDGDGTVSRLKIKNMIYPTPVLYSVNREFLMQMQSLMLLKLGIQCRLKEHNTPKGLMHKLVVRGNEGRIKFLDIDVVSRHKNERLQEIKKVIKIKEHENIPHPSILIEAIMSNLPYKEYRNKDYYVYKTGNATKHSLNVLYDLAKENNLLNQNIENEFNLLMREDIGWEKVQSIENMGKQELFDFTVDKDSFVGAPYFFLHNSKFYGESEKKIRDIFDEAEKNAPSIIFIDEIDAIAPKREEAQGEVERRVVSQLLTMMDGLQSRGKVVVIGATNRPNALDEALRRPGRFDRELEIRAPDKKGRLQILKIHTRNMPLVAPANISYVNNKIKKTDEILKELRISLKTDEKNILDKKKIDDIKKNILDNLEIYNSLIELVSELSENESKNYDIVQKLKSEDRELLNSIFMEGMKEDLASVTHGFVGADIASLAKESAMIVLRRLLPKLELKEDEPISEEVLKELKIAKKDFDEALKVVRPSAMREVLVETPDINWKDVGGLDSVKQELKEAVEWPMKYPDAFVRLGIRPPKGILLYGPPGTGKTLLAKAVAKESEANFIQVKGPSLLSMWVGESEKGVRKIFERARQVSPCIIFFDEIDSLAGKRGIDQGQKVTERVLNQILAEMDGIEDLSNVIVIGATNRPDMLDSALLRPGRFDRILLVGAPSREGREQIFNIHTKNMPLAKDVKIKEIIDKTESYVGADMESLVREAAMLALREDIETKEVKMKYFEEAMKKVVGSVSRGDIERYKNIEEKYLRNSKAALETNGIEYLG